ncbi:hypothetical protein EDD17DRAFT_1899358 [Pisolithus thermaeus]|nr:hypothetical protein EDD17DRAFT_1899358 [Pisolithus thermaeus]
MGIPGGSGSILIGGLFSAMLYGITTLQGRFKRNVLARVLLTGDIDLRVLHALFRRCLDHKIPCWRRMIINYGVPTSLEYDVWSSSLFSSKLLPADDIWQVVPRVPSGEFTCGYCSSVVPLNVSGAIRDIDGTQFVALGKYIRPRWKKIPSSDMAAIDSTPTSSLRLVNEETSVVKQIRFYAATPFVAAFALAEVLITTSLCVLLYDSGTRSSFSSTKRILTTLIIYAVNRCILVLVVALAELITTVELQSAWSMAIDFVIGKSTLNSRQHLRSQGSTTESNEGVHVVHFTNTSKPSEEIKSSEDGERHIGVHEGAVIDITADLPLEKTTALRSEGELGMCDIVSIRSENVGSSKDGERWPFVHEVADTDVTTDPAFEKTTTLRRDAEV